IAKAKDLPVVWGEDQNVRWSVEVEGDSWASPVVWGKKVFVASSFPVKVSAAPERREGAPPGGEDESFKSEVYRWEVTCVDLESGAILWKETAFEGSPRVKKHRAHNYAAETPVTDGKRLYVYFGMTGLYCYSLDGELLWEKDLGAYKTLHDWGTGSSPVIYNEKLYVQVDNEENSFLVALDAASGDEIWKASRDEKTNYSTPMIWENSQRKELIVGGKTARSYDLLTGEVFWELKVPGHYNIPGPVADDDYIYLGNAPYRDTPGTFFCVKAGAEGNITPAEGESTSSGVAWSIMDAPLGSPSPLLHNGLIYLLSSRGGSVSCLDATSGEQVYQEKIEGVAACWASPWLYEDQIYFTDEKGTTRIITAGKTFELVGENKLDDKFWASVAVTSDAYLMKGNKKLYCIGN
ncbi:MAG: PQQ-binding-like beta-propeller repeat protein, partial [Bacteroides sp.]|nr:PQQ-binding-like beta-propeller repeat protein [Bacteroides sp.]